MQMNWSRFLLSTLVFVLGILAEPIVSIVGSEE